MMPNDVITQINKKREAVLVSDSSGEEDRAENNTTRVLRPSVNKK